MATLYETINEILGGNVHQRLGATKVQQISDTIEQNTSAYIGANNYKTLETFVDANKSDNEMQNLVECMVDLSKATLIGLKGNGCSNEEANIGYKTSVNLYRFLNKYNFDLTDCEDNFMDWVFDSNLGKL